MLDPKAITVIFANIEDILLINTVCFQCFSLHRSCLSKCVCLDVSKLIGGATKGLPLVYRQNRRYSEGAHVQHGLLHGK